MLTLITLLLMLAVAVEAATGVQRLPGPATVEFDLGRGRELRLWLICVQGLHLLSLVPWLFLVTVSVFALTTGRASGGLAVGRVVFGVLLAVYPVAVVGCGWLGWQRYRRGPGPDTVVVSVLPVVLALALTLAAAVL